MNLDSKYFDCIRVKPDEDRLMREACPRCDWPGCANPAQHLAPRGRGRDGEYFNFCLEHVREYNKSYNYFNGMSDEEVARFQKASVTGHRPTWRMSLNGHRNGRAAAFTRPPHGYTYSFVLDDPFGVFGRAAGAGAVHEEARERPVRNAERKCLSALGLDESASARDIKARFKLLVKRHHPDHNGGNRASEDKLREVIQAYNYLKEAGLC